LGYFSAAVLVSCGVAVVELLEFIELIKEPELRENFILRMLNIDLEKSIPVEDFGKRYGLK